MFFGAKRERAWLRPDPSTVSAARLVSLFAEVFAAFDACPREVELMLELPDDRRFAIDFEDGEPVFVEGSVRAAASFRRRWLPVDPMPFALGPRTRFLLSPAEGNRVRVAVAGVRSRLARFPRPALWSQVRGRFMRPVRPDGPGSAREEETCTAG